MSESSIQVLARQNRRRGKACVSCRSRKVRCDYAVHGQPCTNCRLDRKSCILAEKAAKRSGRSLPQVPSRDARSANLLSSCLWSGQDTTLGASREATETLSRAVLGISPEVDMTQANEPSDDLGAILDWQINEPQSPTNQMSPFSSYAIGSRKDWNQSQRPPSIDKAPDLYSSNASTMTRNLLLDSDKRHPASLSEPRRKRLNYSIQEGCVYYSHYWFIDATGLQDIEPQDVNYLDSQGCLHIPMQPALDDFIKQYFLHVHPTLPILNEGDFWEMLEAKSRNKSSSEKVCLLVLQALMYSSCAFVSSETLDQLDWENTRTARASLYKRVKLLFDHETESRPIYLAQAALLLTCWVPTTSPSLRPCAMWLSLAVQHARSINADRESMSMHGLEKHRVARRRLWWSCIIRDRISSLCARRNTIIGKEQFDITAVAPLGLTELEDEFSRSRVYSPACKRRLARLLTHYIRFCIVVTDTLSMVFPFENSLQARKVPEPRDSQAIQDCKVQLEAWYKCFDESHPSIVSDSGSLDTRKESPDSVLICSNLLHIYFHSTKIALCHFELLLASVVPIHKGANMLQILEDVQERRTELQQAALQVAECVGEIARHNLIRFLPITASACVAIPLVLHLIDSNSHAYKADTSQDSHAANQKRLDTFKVVMDSLLRQYDGIQWINSTVRNAVDLAQAYQQSLAPNLSQPKFGWDELLIQRPSSYLRMTMTVDLCISHCRLPGDVDFPDWFPGRKGPAAVVCEDLPRMPDHLGRETPASDRDANYNSDNTGTIPGYQSYSASAPTTLWAGGCVSPIHGLYGDMTASAFDLQDYDDIFSQAYSHTTL